MLCHMGMFNSEPLTSIFVGSLFRGQTNWLDQRRVHNAPNLNFDARERASILRRGHMFKVGLND